MGLYIYLKWGENVKSHFLIGILKFNTSRIKFKIKMFKVNGFTERVCNRASAPFQRVCGTEWIQEFRVLWSFMWRRCGDCIR